MAQQLGKGHVFGIPAAIVLYGADATTAISGYVCPNLSGSGLTHSFDVDEVSDQAGNINALIGGMKEKLECEFDFIAQGSSVANAKISATLPTALSIAKITGAPIIPVGAFSDAYNTNVVTVPWIYMGGTLTESAGGKMTGKIKLVRYINITLLLSAPIT